MNLRFFLPLTVAIFCHSAHGEEKTMSPTMKGILEARLSTDKMVMKTEDLPETKKGTQPTEPKERCEVYAVPMPPGVADAFSYTVILEKDTNRFWIHRSGGFAGVTKVFGPGTASPKPGRPDKEPTK